MTVALKVLGVSPSNNPDRISLLATLSGNYGTNGTGDPLNLAPYDQTNNPGGFTNPTGIPLPELPVGLEQAPSLIGQDIAGYQTQVHPQAPTAGATNGVQNTLALKTGAFLR